MKNQEKQKKKSRKPIIIVISVLILMMIIGGLYWIRSANYVSTDDAQLDGNVFSVRASVTAYLKEIKIKDYQYVHKGDTLMVFDTLSLKAKVEQAKASLENAKTKLNITDIQALIGKQNAKASFQSTLSGKENIAVAKARMEKAKSDFQRDKKLLKINAVTQQQYDADKTTYQQAKASYQQAVHQHQSATITSNSLDSKAKAAHHKIAAITALVAQKKAALQLARENLQHAYVIAPCNGIFTKRSVNQGQYVLSGQSLCAIVEDDHLWVTANFKETKLDNIKLGQTVQINVDAYPDLKLKGVVESFGGATGAKFALIPPDNATGNYIKVTQRFPLRIRLKEVPTPSQNQPLLFPGLSVEVKVKLK